MKEQIPHLLLGNDRIAVCKEMLAELSAQSLETLVQNLLTLIGNGLSLLGLLVTLTSYCLFPSLRTVPGLQIMCLVSVLIFAQGMFMVNRVAAGIVSLCRCLTVLQHYAWICAFCWMNTLAVGAFKKFCLKTTRGIKDENSKQFLMYSLYSWGLPAVLIAVSIGCDRLALLPSGYFQEDLCWINGGEALLYLFAIPLLALILVNLVCFSATVVSIWGTMNDSTILNENKENMACIKIYTKLACLMGITWIFGYLANIEKLNFLFYLFIVMNSLQGMFICLAFGINFRTRVLYKKMFRRQPQSSEIKVCQTVHLTSGSGSVPTGNSPPTCHTDIDCPP